MSPLLQAGMLVDGKYRVVEVLKTGAVAQAAVVFSETDPSRTALILRLSVSEADSRLREEARILRTLSFLDGQGRTTGPAPEAAAFADDGTHDYAYYLVTEYIPHDRYTTVRQAWEQGWGESWIVPVCRAFLQFLAKAHKQRVEYYDVKWDHLYWDDANKLLRVIDFNLSRLHAPDEPDGWQQEDLRSTAILMVQMLQKSQNVPTCSYPLPLPPDWSSLDTRGLVAGISEFTRAVVGWLHGGYYDKADAVVDDLLVVERELSRNTEPGTRSRWLGEAIGSRQGQAIRLLQQAGEDIPTGNRDSAWTNLQKAWTCLPFKRVGTNPTDDPLACKVYLHALWLRYLSEDSLMASGFRLWLDGRYDDALSKLATSTHRDSSTALAWLKRRRNIDDPQQVYWNQITVLVQEGRYADALQECARYCQEYTADSNALLWLDYLKKVLAPLKSHWWYDREDRLYAMAMARLPNRLEPELGSQLRVCWQQDEQLQKMCHLMRQAVEVTDDAWQQFALCAFQMAVRLFAEVEKAATAAIELHARTINMSPEQGIGRMRQVVQEWVEGAEEIAGLERQARKRTATGDFSKAREEYANVLDTSRSRLSDYLRQRSAWELMLPLLPEDMAFPKDDRMQRFQVAEGLLVSLVRQQEAIDAGKHSLAVAEQAATAKISMLQKNLDQMQNYREEILMANTQLLKELTAERSLKKEEAQEKLAHVKQEREMARDYQKQLKDKVKAFLGSLLRKFV